MTRRSGAVGAALALAFLAVAGVGCGGPAPAYQTMDPVVGGGTLPSPFTEMTSRLALGMIPAVILRLLLTLWRRRTTSAAAAPVPATTGAADPPPGGALEPLHCPGCDAAVPYSDQPTTRCPHCRTEVDVPPAYRELGPLRRRARELADRTALAWRAHRLLTNHLALPLGVAAYVALMFGSVVLGRACDYAPHHGYYVMLSLALSFGMAACLIALTMAATRIRRIDPTPLVLPPTDHAGFGSCRTCGALVPMPPPAVLVAGCGYCGTEHLVTGRAVRARAVAGAAVTRRAQSLAAASQAVRDQLRKLERRTILLCDVYLVLAALWVVRA